MSSNSSPPTRSSARRHYPHIDDLKNQASKGYPNWRNHSIKKLLDDANSHWHQATSSLAFGKPAQAYVDFLIASNIVVEYLPAAQEYPSLVTTQSAALARFVSLQKSLNQAFVEYNTIKEEIKQDNEKSGVQPTNGALTNGQNGTKSPPRTASEFSQSLDAPAKKRPDVPSKPAFLARNDNSTQKNGIEGRRSAQVADGSELAARFAKLNPPRTGPRGPRDMPLRPKLNVDLSALPKMPAPTYSPATSFSSPGGLSPPRARASISAASGVPAQVPKLQTCQDGAAVTADALFSWMKTGSVLLFDVRDRESFNQGHIFWKSIICVEPIVLREGMSASDLEQALILGPDHEQKFLQQRGTYDVLVYYDQSTQCPTMSPINTDPQLSALRRLHEALYQYDMGNSPKQQPLMLAGGLDAWIEMAGGSHTLKVESDQQSQSQPLPQPRMNGGPIQRKPMRPEVTRAHTPTILSRQPTLEMPAFEQANGDVPIDYDEELRWLERLQKERNPTIRQTSTGTARDLQDLKTKRRTTSVVSTSSDMPNGYVRTVEDFFQRYPELPQQQSMTTPYPQDDTMPSPTRSSKIDNPFYGFSNSDASHAVPARPPPAVPRKSYSGVSERFTPTPAIPKPPERPPKVPMSPAVPQTPTSRGFDSEFGITGLKNMGNTCYMNSMIQCLSGTQPLARYFLNGSYRSHINKDNKFGSRGVLVEAFVEVLRHLWAGEYKFISPLTFKDVVGRMRSQFRNNDQQDAEEFLTILIELLHEDLNLSAGKTRLHNLTEDEERRREMMPIQKAALIEWQRHTHSNGSVITNWLTGQYASRLQCRVCNITSTSYTEFTELSLSIPLTGSTTLDNCMRDFCKAEVLGDGDMWRCPNCKEDRNAVKKLTPTRLPPILILHLKRFRTEGSSFREKVKTPIDFPLNGLDLSPYVPPNLPVDQLQKELQQEGQRREVTPPFLYDLYAVSNHYGTIGGGHYTAYVKGRGKWTEFDDTRAMNLDESRVVSDAAYVLFYVRRDI